MNKELSDQIRDLVGENQLEEALDLLIEREQSAGQERVNTLLILRGKLSMLEEQELAGTLDMEELMQQKARIAHALLKMTEDEPDAPAEAGPPVGTKHIEIRKTVPASTSAGSSPVVKYLLIGVLLIAGVAAGISIVRFFGSDGEKDRDLSGEKTEQPKTENPETSDVRPEEVHLLDFPNLNIPFNFSDIRYTFQEANLEKYSDGSAAEPATFKLTLKMNLECRSNLGICYRETFRILVDGQPVEPAERQNYAGWIEHNASATDVLIFILDAGAREFSVELEKNKSFWRRSMPVYRSDRSERSDR